MSSGRDKDARALRRRIQGQVVARDDPSFDAVRTSLVWNQLVPDARPALVVRVASSADVVEAVRFARAGGLRVAVRGRGHSWIGAPLRDDALLLDLEGLRRLDVDPGARVAVAEPAVTGQELADALTPRGLAFPYGHCACVPLGGYALAGGLGWNAGVWGPACASVREVELVTAAGDVVRASADVQPDLLWAARGAGAGFFGVATRFHLTLRPQPAAIATTTHVHPLAEAAPLASWAAGVTRTLPPHVEVTVHLGAVPGGMGRGCAVSATAFADDERAARDVLAPLARSPGAAVRSDVNQATPFDVLMSGVSGAFPERHRYLADALWSDAPAATVVGALEAAVAAAPSPRSLVLVALRPPPLDAPPPGMAFSMTAPLLVLVYAIWDDPAADDANRRWHAGAVAAVEHLAVGRYVGEANLRHHEAARCYAPESWARLESLRRRWDPDGLFHAWPGVSPATGSS